MHIGLYSTACDVVIAPTCYAFQQFPNLPIILRELADYAPAACLFIRSRVPTGSLVSTSSLLLLWDESDGLGTLNLLRNNSMLWHCVG